jgi:Pectate lyase superfamily protein
MPPRPRGSWGFYDARFRSVRTIPESKKMLRRHFLRHMTAATGLLTVGKPAMTSAAEFGAVGDGQADDTVALNAAAQELPETGGVLHVPPGRYRISNTLVLKSTTTLLGYGATIFAENEWEPSAVRFSLLMNAGYSAPRLLDHDIVVAGVAFEYAGRQSGTAHALEFRKVRNLHVERCSFFGGGNATAFLACQNTLVSDCISESTLNCGFDHWEGSSDCAVHGCTIKCKRCYGILFTGAGTQPGDDHNAFRVRAIGNLIYSPTEAGIWVCSLSEKSSVSNIILERNRVFGGAFDASGIGASGAIEDITIDDNVVENLRGGPAIFVRGDQWNRPRDFRVHRNRMVACETNKTNVALIQVLGDNGIVSNNNAAGGSCPALLWAEGRNIEAHDNSGGTASCVVRKAH